MKKLAVILFSVFASFSFAQEAPVPAIQRTGNELSLTWTGGSAPFIVEQSTNFLDWSAFGSATDDRTIEIPDVAPGSLFYRVTGSAVEQTAIFRITISTNWTSEVFETVPADNRFSPARGITHNSDVSLWTLGEIASPGLEIVAEQGGTLDLSSEIAGFGADVNGQFVFPTIGPNPDSVITQLPSFSRQVLADRDFPLFTLLSGVRPSPDWFIGVDSVSLLDADGNWFDILEIDLFPHDAGTEDGDDFDSLDIDTEPREVTRLISDTAPFQVTAGNTSPQPIGRLVIERVTE